MTAICSLPKSTLRSSVCIRWLWKKPKTKQWFSGKNRTPAQEWHTWNIHDVCRELNTRTLRPAWEWIPEFKAQKTAGWKAIESSYLLLYNIKFITMTITAAARGYNIYLVLKILRHYVTRSANIFMKHWLFFYWCTELRLDIGWVYFVFYGRAEVVKEETKQNRV